MIHELRMYTTPPGMAPELANTSADIAREIRGDEYGKLEGYWVSEVGSLNKCIHLWSYNDLNHREERRAALSKNERWRTEYLPKVYPLVLRQDIRLLAPAREIAAPANEGNLYELRYYRCKTGKAAQFIASMNESMAARERYSRNVGLWTTMAGQPNEVCHLWAYESFEQRLEARKGAAQDKDWRAFLGSAKPIIEEMDNMILLPWRQSPLK